MAEYTWEQAMQTMDAVFEYINKRSDQEAWRLVYWLVDNGHIQMGEVPTENQIKLALDND